MTNDTATGTRGRAARISPAKVDPTWLCAGFRPFFLLASAQAVFGMSGWLLMLAGREVVPGYWPPTIWHAHELLFGFVAAAIAGFLLTAVPAWTETPRMSGRALLLPVGVWLAGRVALWCAGSLPPALVAALDLAFLPLLAGLVAPPILHAHQRRNLPVIGVLLGLALTNLAVHAERLGLVAAGSKLERGALLLALQWIVLLIALIAGRIIPLFTRSALARSGRVIELPAGGRLERLVFAALLVSALLDVAREGSTVTGWVEIATGALLAARQLRWRPALCLDQPILWILHAGHAWLALGFALRGLSCLVSGVPPTAGLHALTAGGIGTMVLAVMSRVALGHTGRPLVAPRTVVLAYWLVLAGAGVRVVAPFLASGSYPASLRLAGTLWASGYLVFGLRYAPILLGPQADAQTG